jgi:uncharacterized repeat protein (TIGR01451 family)
MERVRTSALVLLGFLLSLSVPPLPLASPVGGPFAYITNFMSNSVSVIDTATNTVVATIAVGSRPIGVAVSPDGLRVYVANYAGSSVSVIDTAANAVIATVSLASPFPIGIAVSPDGSRVYVTHDATTGHVSVIDTATYTVVATISVGVPGDDLTGIAVNPSGTRVYVAHSQTWQVSVIDTLTNTVTATIPVGPVGVFPVGVAVHPSGQWVYVANQGSNNVQVINATTNTVAATIPVGSEPTGVAVNPSGSRIYVTNQGDDTVSVINAGTNMVDATIPVGSAPLGVSVTPDGSRVYVANRGSNNVSVINALTNAVTTTVSVGTQPVAFGQFIGPAPEANLRITKVAPAVVNVAQAFTYVIEVRNLGPWDAADVSVSDPVPEGAIVTSVSGAGWTCGVSGDVVTCHRPVLAAGASAPPISISVRAPALGGFVLNTATVSSAVTDPTMGNNTSTAETELIHQDLAAFAVHSLRGAASGIPVEGVLVATSTEDQVRVFLNRGDGTFVLKQRLSVGRGPVAVAVGDLTGDGITDAVTANLRGRSLTLLQGEGDGTFRKGRTLSVEGQPWALALADVDRDGRGDLVLAYGDRDAVQILTGRGDGTFRAGRRYPVGRRPSSLAVADLNHDGWLDLVVANSGAHSLTLLFGQGAGTFTPVTVEVGKNPLRVAVGDLDGDGRPEIVVTHYREAALSIVALRSRGEQAWTAQPVRALPTGEGPIGIAFGRFSPEAVSLACVGAIAEEVWIYGAEGRSPLSLRQRLPTSAPVSLVTGDVNGDGRQDLILLDVGGRLSVWFSTEEGRLHRRQ